MLSFDFCLVGFTFLVSVLSTVLSVDLVRPSVARCCCHDCYIHQNVIFSTIWLLSACHLSCFLRRHVAWLCWKKLLNSQPTCICWLFWHQLLSHLKPRRSVPLVHCWTITTEGCYSVAYLLCYLLFAIWYECFGFQLLVCFTLFIGGFGTLFALLCLCRFL